MDPAKPELRSQVARARPWQVKSCAGPWGSGPSPLFHVRPLQDLPAQRDLGLRCLSLQERIRLFEAGMTMATSQGPGPRVWSPGGQDSRPSGRVWPPHIRSEGTAPSRVSLAPCPSRAWPPAQREQAEQAWETRPPPTVGPGRSVREQVRSFELRFGAGQASVKPAAPYSRGGRTGAQAAAGLQQSRAVWSQTQEPHKKGGPLLALSAGVGLPPLEPSAPEQPQHGREGGSKALGLEAQIGGARALGLPQRPVGTCSLWLEQASRPQVAQGEASNAKGLPGARPAEGPFWSRLPRHGPLTSSPVPAQLPADSDAPKPPLALPSVPWGLGEPDGIDSDSTESSLSTPSEQSQPDSRSFSLSLVELREFGLDGKEAPQAERCSASLSSSLSLIPAHNLEQLLEEVMGLGEESLQHLEEIQVVVLHKDEGVELGFSIAGGNELHQKVTIHRVFASGLAAQEGTIQPGDEVLSINGHSLTGCSHKEALQALERARPARQAVVVLRKGAAGRLPKGSLSAPCPRPPLSAPDEPVMEMPVELVKDAHGLGFSLAGGRASLQGDRPLTIKKIFLGGPAELLQPGDELLQIQERQLQGLSRLEAWNLIRDLPAGPVRLLVRRRKP